MAFNNKLSGAKAVVLPINKLGNNYFPFVEEFRNRMIKYIDVYPFRYLPDTEATGCTDIDNTYITIADKTGNEYIVNGLPLMRFDYTYTLGRRQPICREISLQNSFVNVTNSALVGKSLLFVFWYDMPEFSAKNKTDLVVFDGLTIPLTSEMRQNLLPDNDRMAGKRFRKIYLATPNITPDFLSSVAPTDLKYLYITLRKGSINIIENVPLYSFLQFQKLEQATFANIIFDFHSSFITIGGAGTLPGKYIGKCVYLNFAYEK